MFSILILSSCSNTTTSVSTNLQVSSSSQNNDNIQIPSWPKELVLNYGGYSYDVTNETTKDIVKKIGIISFHGNLGVSFELYSIKGIDDYRKIAVRTKDGYLIAVRSN